MKVKNKISGKKIGAVILAAGSSRRFGEDKRRAKLPSGRSILETTIDNAAACLKEVIVVLRHDDTDIAQLLSMHISNPGVSYYSAPESADGMAHSLANVIKTLNGWDAAMVFLGDMPYIAPSTIEQLLNRYQSLTDPQPILVPTYQGKQGHPVIFDHHHFKEIENLKGDQGARQVLRNNADDLHFCAVMDDGVLIDIDLPKDLRAG